MKILTYTTLYPNAAAPLHGIFVENRLSAMLATHPDIEAQVVAPVPWFPLPWECFRGYAQFARCPATETRRGIKIVHPRFPAIPKLGMSIAPTLLYAATIGTVRRLLADGFDFDVIDAHYFYPDGVAAAMIARSLGKPVTIVVHGSDITLLPRFAIPRWQIKVAARWASSIVTVSRSLKENVAAVGVPRDKIGVSPNGADLSRFYLADRGEIRRFLGLQGPLLLSVGALIPRKSHEILISALPLMPDVRAMIAGTGSEESRLRALARRLGVEDRVRFLGAVPQEKLCALYNAADAMVLASSREGWASVLMESMASGTPVIASAVDGTPEAMASPDAGIILPERTPEALANAVRRLLSAPPDRARTRAYAERFSWARTIEDHVQRLRSSAACRHRVSAAAPIIGTN